MNAEINTDLLNVHISEYLKKNEKNFGHDSTYDPTITMDATFINCMRIARVINNDITAVMLYTIVAIIGHSMEEYIK